MSNAQCQICPHMCIIPEGKTGKCTARANQNGKITPASYAKITSIALDPIEKKPLRMFHPNTRILSVGSYGCNLHCQFCQNHAISMPDTTPHTTEVPPETLLQLAQKYVPDGNIGVAFTYNEPLINYEYVLDCAKLLQSANLKSVLVTNGYINPAPLQALLPYIHAMNIDLKSFFPDFYKKIGGGLQTVKNTIETAHNHCHIEISTLVIPDENENDIEPIAAYLAEISPNIPLHLLHFRPHHKYADRRPTPHDTIHRVATAARKYLNYVL